MNAYKRSKGRNSGFNPTVGHQLGLLSLPLLSERGGEEGGRDTSKNNHFMCLRLNV